MTRLALGAAVGAVFTLASAGAMAAVTYVYDRAAPFSAVQMGCSSSTGESLANGCTGPGLGAGQAESSAGGDIRATFTWSDGTSFSGVWQSVSGKTLGGDAVLFPVTAAPGVHFDVDATPPFYRGFIEQSGDTFANPWEIRNGSSAFGLAQVILEAIGTPDMGFDTDDGAAPDHGAGGFPLMIATGSEYTGDLRVTYSLWNNWNGSTDMFHRMTIDFLDQGGLLPTSSLVFLQDTDEATAVPEPASLALLAAGVGMLAAARRRRRPAA